MSDDEIESLPDVSEWRTGFCDACGGPVLWRWTGLQMVERTCDARLASREIQHVRPDLELLARAVEWYERWHRIGSGAPGWYEEARRMLAIKEG
jgi:hypothetical protein